MSKRTNGEGTIYQDKKGLWRGELTIGYDDNGRRIKKQFSSMDLEVLQKKMNDEKYNLNRNIVIKNSDYTLKEWLEFWLHTYKLNSVKPRTYDYYESAFILYVYDSIGNSKLDKLKTIQIQQLYNELSSRGFATSTIRSVHVPLNQAFEQAINNELLFKNPCKGLVVPKKPPRESRPFTVEEQNKFEAACKNTTYHNFFIFLLNTGLRCGEGMAITWDDVNSYEKLLSVNKTISQIVNREKNPETKKIQVIQTTKTESGTRIVPLNKKSIQILESQSKDNAFVFSSNVGTVLSQRNLIRGFNILLDKSNLPKDLTVHSLRHSFATRLLEKGANIKAVSEILGHKNIQITMNLYSHALPNFKRQTIELLD